MKHKESYTPPYIPKAETKERSKVERLFGNLGEQYKNQAKALYYAGILNLMEDGKTLGYKDIDGKERPFPSYERIVKSLEANYELVEKKFQQGFTNLRLDLIGLPVGFLFDILPEEIRKAKNEGRLKSTDGTELELDADDPFRVYDYLKEEYASGELSYGDMKFSEEGVEGGVSQEEYLKEHPSGYLIRLDENMPDLPEPGQGKTVGGRKQQEAGKKPFEYQAEMQANGESGETINSQIINFIVNLRKGVVIDDLDGKGKINWLTGSALKNRNSVLFWKWDRFNRQAALRCYYVYAESTAYSCRASVIIPLDNKE